MPLLRLREHLLQDEHVGVRRVDEFGIDLGGDDVADVRQHVSYFIVRVGRFQKPIVAHNLLSLCCNANQWVTFAAIFLRRAGFPPGNRN